jgi:hypothetical protein
MQLGGVLRGGNPSEVEQPTRFETMITLKTALDIDIRPGCSRAPTRRSSKDFFAARHVCSWHIADVRDGRRFYLLSGKRADIPLLI